MKRLTLAALALLVVAMNTQIADAASGRRSQGGPQRFYDESGQFRGYAWCRSRGGWTSMNPPDCSYYTQQQCTGRHASTAALTKLDLVAGQWTLSSQRLLRQRASWTHNLIS
jgi:hypothetical protein